MFIFLRSPLKVYLHGHFHGVVAVQRRQRNVQKSVMHVQSRCFANVKLLFCRFRCLSYLLGTLRSNDADGKKNVKKKNNRFYKQNNNFARASRFFVHFFACFCTTTTENAQFSVLWGRKPATTKLNFSFCTRIWSLGIQLQEGSPTYVKVRGQE